MPSEYLKPVAAATRMLTLLQITGEGVPAVLASKGGGRGKSCSRSLLNEAGFGLLSPPGIAASRSYCGTSQY